MTKIIYSFIKILKCILIITLLINLWACEASQAMPASKNKKQNSSHKLIWGRLRDNFEMTSKPNQVRHQHVEKYVKKFTQEQKTLKKISTQATPYLYYIVEQLEKRDMPGELALLPMIESAFQPQATSHRGAAGLWQFIPSTGKSRGLKQDAWYDGRRDIKASTEAALDYLQFLHKEFDHNWMLALAAYNAGEGAIRRAIKRNKQAGKPTTFWDLNLPKETKEYVPKFLALAQVIGNPETHAISLAPINNQPYFTPVNPGTTLNFQQVAKLANIHINELKRLNPGYRRASTHPKGPQELLLPIANVKNFQYNHNLNKKR